ncbi:UDP-3-O-(3-hydroxymyristoyl)glucosamine N-acyltransferase [Mesobacillus campisalis]|uniref:UDP-3-O-(3-hydroxymyristoyl)glucosamine N-acyltransferase n=1 Tax=Mesobacillus campisalis TaxID=1408103 RepID=UPI00069AC0B0|nr:UDP-3-O-(3-hydroxymyristoyl)glucosamine N-acyltransferase [Mesobacillus campisalis]
MEMNLKLDTLLEFLRVNKLLTQPTIGEMNKDFVITGFSSIYDSKANTLSRMEAQTFEWSSIKSAAVLCSLNAVVPKDAGIVFIPVENPRDTFAIVVNEFYPKPALTGISDTAVISQNNVQIGRNVYIGHGVIIGDNVCIGEETKIFHNVVIGNDVSIGSNCIIHSGTVIGADGFGYQKNLQGEYVKFPHLGGVQLGDYVEVGSNTVIARGKLSDTVIKKNVKIGNLNHISHDVVIHEHGMITHQTHLGGNTTVMQNSWIAPGVILKQGITIGEGSLAGMGSVVIRDVNAFDTVAGIPAKPINKKDSK